MGKTPRINEIFSLVLKVSTEFQLANCSVFVPRRREHLVADSGQSRRRDVQCRRRRWPQALSTWNPVDRLKGVSHVGGSKSTEALVLVTNG